MAKFNMRASAPAHFQTILVPNAVIDVRPDGLYNEHGSLLMRLEAIPEKPTWGNPYEYPGKCGLEIVATLEGERSWAFDMVVCWEDDDGDLWAAHDSGCSCPSPFEDVTSKSDLVAINALDDIKPLIDSISPAPSYAAILVFSNRVREALRV